MSTPNLSEMIATLESELHTDARNPRLIAYLIDTTGAATVGRTCARCAFELWPHRDDERFPLFFIGEDGNASEGAECFHCAEKGTLGVFTRSFGQPKPRWVYIDDRLAGGYIQRFSAMVAIDPHCLSAEFVFALANRYPDAHRLLDQVDLSALWEQTCP